MEHNFLDNDRPGYIDDSVSIWARSNSVNNAPLREMLEGQQYAVEGTYIEMLSLSHLIQMHRG